MRDHQSILRWLALPLLLITLNAHAVVREVLVEGARTANLPQGSISLSGTGISNVEVEQEERPDGVLLRLTYDSNTDNHAATLELPPSAGPVTTFGLPNSLEPVAINTRSGAVLNTVDPAPIAANPRPFAIGLSYGAGQLGAEPVRSPAVQVSPNEGFSPNNSADEIDTDEVGLSFNYRLSNGVDIRFTVRDFEGDESSDTVIGTGTGATWGWLFPDLFMGGTGVLVGDFGSTINNDLDLDGQEFRFGFGIPIIEDCHGWQIESEIELGYIERDYELQQSMVFDAPFTGLSATQAIDAQADTWEIEVGLRGLRPLSDQWAVIASTGLVYQRLEVDADVVHTSDIFGAITTIDVEDSGDGHGLGIQAALGIQFQHRGFTLEGTYTHRWNQEVIDIQGTTNGDNILEGERFRVGTTGDEAGIFRVEGTFRF